MEFGISKVYSFKDAWNTIKEHNQSDLEEIIEVINQSQFSIILSNKIAQGAHVSQNHFIDSISKARRTLVKKQWVLMNFHSGSGSVHFVKNNLCFNLGFQTTKNTPFLQWAITESQNWVNYSQGGIALAIVFATQIDLGHRFAEYSELSVSKDLPAISAIKGLNSKHPFLVLVIDELQDTLPPKVSHILKKTRSRIEKTSSRIENPSPQIDKSIEFPPELYEAGRGILSFFGTYLNEKYPDQQARVKIEQDPDGETLRMTVESESGKKEVIEKALNEYQLIVTGKAKIEDLTNNENLILSLRDEARILQFRMESQGDKISLMQGQIQKKDLRIDRLLDIVEKGLENKTPIHIVNSANSDSSSSATAKSSATATAEAHQNLSLAIGGVAELKELMPAGGTEARELEQLEQGLQAIKKEQDPEVVSTSPAMVKFKRVLEKIKSKEGKLAKAVEAAENGYEVFKDVATTYNKIADWCGLPHVPGVLL